MRKIYYTIILCLAIILIHCSHISIAEHTIKDKQFSSDSVVNLNGIEYKIHFTENLQAVVIRNLFSNVVVQNDTCNEFYGYRFCLEGFEKVSDARASKFENYQAHLKVVELDKNGKHIGKVCMNNSQCITQNCLHNICTPKDSICGDGYCDKEESCQKDCLANSEVLSTDPYSVSVPSKSDWVNTHYKIKANKSYLINTTQNIDIGDRELAIYDYTASYKTEELQADSIMARLCDKVIALNESIEISNNETCSLQVRINDALLFDNNGSIQITVFDDSYFESEGKKQEIATYLEETQEQMNNSQQEIQELKEENENLKDKLKNNSTSKTTTTLDKPSNEENTGASILYILSIIGSLIYIISDINRNNNKLHGFKILLWIIAGFILGIFALIAYVVIYKSQAKDNQSSHNPKRSDKKETKNEGRVSRKNSNKNKLTTHKADENKKDKKDASESKKETFNRKEKINESTQNHKDSKESKSEKTSNKAKNLDSGHKKQEKKKPKQESKTSHRNDKNYEGSDLNQKETLYEYSDELKEFEDQHKDKFSACSSLPEHVKKYAKTFKDDSKLSLLAKHIQRKMNTPNYDFIYNNLKSLYEREREQFGPNIINDLKEIDDMTGEEFEIYLQKMFRKIGYNVKKTKAAKDGGVDLVLKKENETTLIQAKRYKITSKVGVNAVRDVYSKKQQYVADKLVVLTTSMGFTREANYEASNLDVELWARDQFKKLLKQSKMIKNG